MGAYRRAFSLKLSYCRGRGEGSRDSGGNCACFHLMLRSYYVASALLSCPKMYKLCQVALLQAAPTANLLPPFPCCLPLSFGVPFGPIVLSISVERSWSVLLAAAQLLWLLRRLLGPFSRVRFSWRNQQQQQQQRAEGKHIQNFPVGSEVSWKLALPLAALLCRRQEHFSLLTRNFLPLLLLCSLLLLS